MSRRSSRRMRPRRGARQQGGHTHFVPSVNRHYHDINAVYPDRTQTGKIIGTSTQDILTESDGAGFTSTHFTPGHGAGNVPESFYPGSQWPSNYGAQIDGSHPGHTRPGLVKPRGGRRSSQKGKLGGAARISTVRGTPRRRR